MMAQGIRIVQLMKLTQEFSRLDVSCQNKGMTLAIQFGNLMMLVTFDKIGKMIPFIYFQLSFLGPIQFVVTTQKIVTLILITILETFAIKLKRQFIFKGKIH